MACITARVTSSASVSFGVIPTAGRHGARCGDAFSRSSVFTYSAVARESKSGVTTALWAPSPHARSRSLGIDHLGFGCGDQGHAAGSTGGDGPGCGPAPGPGPAGPVAAARRALP